MLSLLAACDGPPSTPPPPELTISSTDAAQGTRGQEGSFTVTVTNPTSHEVKNVALLEIDDLDKTTFLRASCSAQGGAICPQIAGMGMGPWLSPSMPGHSVLTFEVSVFVAYNAEGIFENHLILVAENRMGGLDAAGHGTVVADDRNGHYRMYWSSGRISTATLDFMRGSFAPANGSSGQAFVLGEDGAYFISANARFTTSPDLVMGNLDGGDGLETFVAARRLAATVAELNGKSFNVFSSEIGTSRHSRAFAAWFSGGKLTTCEDEVMYSRATCPAASQRHYALTVANSVFTGTDAAHGKTLRFQVAKSRDSLFFLRAGLTADFHGLQIGVPANTGFTGALDFAAANIGSSGWVALLPDSYSAQWTTADGGTLVDNASLAPVPGANSGLVQGQRFSDNATIYLAQDGPMGVAIGAPDGVADGEMQILMQPFFAP